MPSPTETKRLAAAAALREAIQASEDNHPRRPNTNYVFKAVDAITEYSIAIAIDHLTSIASSMIFRHSGPVPDEQQPGPSSDPG